MRSLPYYAALLASGLFRRGELAWERSQGLPSGDPALQDLLRTEIHALSVAVQYSSTGSRARDFWQGNEGQLCALVEHGDLDTFLRWPMILDTMFTDRSPLIWREFAYLRQHPLWESRWLPATRESPVGQPYRFMLHPPSSANLLHHAYHLCRLEERSRRKVADMQYIVEFGGGYGSMARLCHNLGFRGHYVLFDLPAFAALQRYYLNTLGLPCADLTKSPAARLGTLSELAQLVSRQVPAEGSLFIATLSLCETPMALREQLLPWLSGFEQVLVTYSEQFGEADNVAYFRSMQQRLEQLAWASPPLHHPPLHHMLVGVRQCNPS